MPVSTLNVLTSLSWALEDGRMICRLEAVRYTRLEARAKIPTFELTNDANSPSLDRMSVFHRRVLLLSLIIGSFIGLEVVGYCGSQQIYLKCLQDFERYAEKNWHLAAYSRLPSFIGRWGQDNPDSVLNELEAAPLSPPVRTASHHQANKCRFLDQLADGM